MGGGHERQTDVELPHRLLVLSQRHPRQRRRKHAGEKLEEGVAEPHPDALPLGRIEDPLLVGGDQRQGGEIEHVAIDDRPRIEDELPLRLVGVHRQERLARREARGTGVVEEGPGHAARGEAPDVGLPEGVGQRRRREQRGIVEAVGLVGEGKQGSTGEEIRLVILDEIEKPATAEDVADLLGEVGRIPDCGHADVVGRDMEWVLPLADVLDLHFVEEILHAGVVLELLPEPLHGEIEIVKQHQPHVPVRRAEEAGHLEDAEEAGRHRLELERGHEDVDRPPPIRIDLHLGQIVDPVDEEVELVGVVDPVAGVGVAGRGMGGDTAPKALEFLTDRDPQWLLRFGHGASGG